jgi:hypothetical protein
MRMIRRRKIPYDVLYTRGLNLHDFLVQHKMAKTGFEYWRFLGGKFAPSVDHNNIYDLYAVVNHIGALGTGHYVANVLNESDNKWKCFNDHLCRDINEQDVISSSAYILFYTRRDMKSLPIHHVFPTNMTSAVSDETMAAMLEDRDGAARCMIS